MYNTKKKTERYIGAGQGRQIMYSRLQCVIKFVGIRTVMVKYINDCFFLNIVSRRYENQWMHVDSMHYTIQSLFKVCCKRIWSDGNAECLSHHMFPWQRDIDASDAYCAFHRPAFAPPTSAGNYSHCRPLWHRFHKVFVFKTSLCKYNTLVIFNRLFMQ